MVEGLQGSDEAENETPTEQAGSALAQRVREGARAIERAHGRTSRRRLALFDLVPEPLTRLKQGLRHWDN